MNQTKDIRITVRLTPEQYESICARAETAQMTPSTYIRAAAMRHKVVVVDGLKEFTHELKGIGRNLNQLAMPRLSYSPKSKPSAAGSIWRGRSAK